MAGGCGDGTWVKPCPGHHPLLYQGANALRVFMAEAVPARAGGCIPPPAEGLPEVLVRDTGLCNAHEQMDVKGSSVGRKAGAELGRANLPFGRLPWGYHGHPVAVCLRPRWPRSDISFELGWQEPQAPG